MTDETQNTGTTAEQTSTTGAADTTTTGTTNVGTSSWRDALPDDLKGEPCLQSINDVQSLAKGYKEAQSMIGGRIPIPSAEASAEVQEEFFTKLTSVPGVVRLPNETDPKRAERLSSIYDQLGRPKSAKDYQVELPEGFPVNEKGQPLVDTGFLEQVCELAHKEGLSKSQLNNLSKAIFERDKQQYEIINKYKEASESHLKKEWGEAYKENINLSKAVLDKFEKAFPDAVSDLRNSPIGCNPVVLSALAELGRFYSESGTVVVNTHNARSGAMTPAQAQQAISDMYANHDHPIYKSGHPEHQKALETKDRLYQMAYPEQEKSE